MFELRAGQPQTCSCLKATYGIPRHGLENADVATHTFAMHSSYAKPVLGNVSLVVTDAYGQAATHTLPVVLRVEAAPPPVPRINNSKPVSLTIDVGAEILLNDAGTSCVGGGCTTRWSLSCPNSRGSFVNHTGGSVSISVGRNSSFTINANGATTHFNCEAWRGARADAACSTHLVPPLISMPTPFVRLSSTLSLSISPLTPGGNVRRYGPSRSDRQLQDYWIQEHGIVRAPPAAGLQQGGV